MKSIFKRAAAVVLALAMCAGLTGCYSEDKTWAAKLGDTTTLPIGSYIYYYSSAYSEGAALVDSGAEVLKSDIEGKSADQWISDRAMDFLRSYCYVDNKFNELGLALSDEDRESVENATASMWIYYKSVFEDLGVAESSFKEAYAMYNMKTSLLLQAMYGEGGELELPEDELHDYYTGSRVCYQYFRADLTETDEEGNSVDMDDDRKADVKAMMKDAARLVDQDRKTLEEAAGDFGTISGTEPYVGDSAAVRIEDLGDSFKETLTGLENGEASLVETDTAYYVVQRLDIEDDFEELTADRDRLISLLSEMKGDDFMDYTIEEGAKLDINVNSKAIATVKPNKIAEAMGKSGTSYAPVEDGDDNSGAEE